MDRQTAALQLGVVIATLFALIPLAQSQAATRVTPTQIEVFVTSGQAINAIDSFRDHHPKIIVEIHKLDAIKQLEDLLSKGLPSDPAKAKDWALKRLQTLSQTELEQSARSLAKAVQYGLEKYPAIVFDGEFVVYGLTDLGLGLMHYRHWHARAAS